VVTISFCATAAFTSSYIIDGNPWYLALLICLGILLLIMLVSLHAQPVSRAKLAFKVN